MIYLSTRTSYSGSHSTLNAAERMERRAEASYYFAPLDFRSASIRHDTVKSTPFGLSNRGVYRISEVVVRMGCTIPRGYYYPVVGFIFPWEDPLGSSASKQRPGVHLWNVVRSGV